MARERFFESNKNRRSHESACDQERIDSKTEFDERFSPIKNVSFLIVYHGFTRHRSVFAITGETRNRYVRAGLSFYKTNVYKEEKKPQEARALFADFLARVPAEMHPSSKN